MPWRLKINTIAMEWRKARRGHLWGLAGERGELGSQVMLVLFFHVSYIFNFSAVQAGWKGSDKVPFSHLVT